MEMIAAAYRFCFAFVLVASGNASALDQNGSIEITDEQLITFLKDKSTLWDMSNKRSVLGNHNGNRVVADHPCSDLCPMYTVRVVHYDLPLDKCKEKGGLIAEVEIPVSITRGVNDYCVPPAIKSLIYLDKIDNRMKSEGKSLMIRGGDNKAIREECIKFFGSAEKNGICRIR